MNNLGVYYEEQKDYFKMMKYYLMACKNGYAYNNTIINKILNLYYDHEFAKLNVDKLNEINRKKFVEITLNFANLITEDCMICKETKNDIIKIECNHKICKECFYNWYSKNILKYVYCTKNIVVV
jgi:hypothetical protein